MNWRIALNRLILIVLVIVAIYSFTRIAPSLTKPETPYALLYYYQPGCPACDKIEPTIDALEERYAGCVTVRRLNLQWARSSGVRATPTILLVDSKGEEIARWVGVQPMRNFTGKLDSLCKKEKLLDG